MRKWKIIILSLLAVLAGVAGADRRSGAGGRGGGGRQAELGAQLGEEGGADLWVGEGGGDSAQRGYGRGCDFWSLGVIMYIL